MGRHHGKKGQFLREIVMITSFAMLVILVSVGLYADPGQTRIGHDLELKLSSLLPPAGSHY